MITGREIYQQRLLYVKGIHRSYQQAGLQALEKARSQMERTITPNLVLAIQE